MSKRESEKVSKGKMDIDMLRLLIAEGEGLTVEFKEKYTSKIDRDIVAFANTRGGHIINFKRPPYSLKGSAKGSQTRSQRGSQRGSQTSSQKIVTMMSGNSAVTIEELARNLHINPRTIKKHIKVLRDQGSIKRIGPDFGGHWEVVKDDGYGRQATTFAARK